MNQSQFDKAMREAFNTDKKLNDAVRRSRVSYVEGQNGEKDNVISNEIKVRERNTPSPVRSTNEHNSPIIEEMRIQNNQRNYGKEFTTTIEDSLVSFKKAMESAEEQQRLK